MEPRRIMRQKARYEMLVRQCSATSSVVDVNRQRMSQSSRGSNLPKLFLKLLSSTSATPSLSPRATYTSHKEIQVGQLVQPGADPSRCRRFRRYLGYGKLQENPASARITPGSKVEVTVDAIPGVVFNGEVSAISTATGHLSLIPQDNSAGNFVKVRQRIPVRIEFAPDNKPEDMARLRAGMNVECRVKY